MLSLYWLVAFCALPSLCSTTTNGNNVDEYSSDEQIVEVIFPTIPIVVSGSSDEHCRSDSRLLRENLRNATTWAMQMWDASAKSAVGVFTGNTYQMGDFDECVGTVVPVRGQYCLTTLTLTRHGADKVDPLADIYRPDGKIWDKISYRGDPTKIRRDVIHWALCVPASCAPGDVASSVTRHLAARNGSGVVDITVDVTEALCQTNRQGEAIPKGTIVYCGILALILVIVLASTLLDFALESDEFLQGFKGITAVEYLLCFSLKKNFSEIAARDPNDRIDCIYGMRLISICLIIIDHRSGISIAGPIKNYEFVEETYHKFYAVFMYRGELIVDTFFLISGLLLSYIGLLSMANKKPQYFLSIVVRYMRLTPIYAAVIFFYTSVIYQMGDGPMWDQVIGAERNACQSNWWTNLLYINNYVNDENMCMVHSWFLPCDMHLFILGMLLVILVRDRPKVAYVVYALLLAASIAIPFAITYVGQKAPLLYFHPEFFISPRTHEVFRSMYTKSHTRASPYLVGMATGYIIFKTQNYKKKFTWQPMIGILVSCLVCGASLLPTKAFYDYTWQYDVVDASFFAGLHRFAWAVGTAIFMLSIVFSKKSMIGAVLSWTPMVALSKLVYCTYLVHMTIQTMHSASMRSPLHLTFTELIRLSISDVVWSLLVALILYLTIEAPVRLIFKRLMKKQHRFSDIKTETDLKDVGFIPR